MKRITQLYFKAFKKTFKNIMSQSGIFLANVFCMNKRIACQSGFSLVEVLIVIAIIIIISALAMPSLQGYVINRSLKSAAREVISDINEFKERAIAENRAYRITLTPNSPNYTIEQCANTGATCNGFQNFQNKSLALFENSIKIETSGTTATQYDFQTRGTVNAGTIQLINQRGSTSNIVTNITGRASVQFIMQ
ncbi:MAG: GspH/FimT family pseudopilin [Nitrospirae bacterium]|nr:GspH/FimT family pseudopilin [Nitrospirota bacterium]